MFNLNELITNTKSFFLIAGPCAIESEEMAFKICEEINDVAKEFEINFVFKGSFKKANRSRLDSFTGIGDQKALEILKKVGNEFAHNSHKVEAPALLTAKSAIDILLGISFEKSKISA